MKTIAYKAKERAPASPQPHPFECMNGSFHPLLSDEATPNDVLNWSYYGSAHGLMMIWCVKCSMKSMVV